MMYAAGWIKAYQILEKEQISRTFKEMQTQNSVSDKTNQP